MQVEVSQFANWDGARAAIERAAAMLRPPPDLKPSEWAEGNIRIPVGNAVPGLIRFDNAPYQREPLDMTARPDCHRITLMWGAQTGKTQVMLCSKGYHIAHNPCSQIMMQPSQNDLQTWLETKFTPMVEANPVLAERMAKPRGREGVNNQRMKSYPGGFLMFSWSGSPKTMRGRSAPVIYCDEVDGYEITAEGHPVSLLWQRAATFGDAALLLDTSTPTIKDASAIEASFQEGDQRRYHVPCAHCGELQTLKWSQVTWQQDPETGAHLPETAVYACESCGAAWNDGERIAAIRGAEEVGGGWIAAKPFRGHASYHLNELYSCFRRLRQIVQSFLDKKSTNDLQTFVNVSLAETWEEQAEKLDSHALQKRVETYRAQVPAGGVYLTAGIDMQQDRLEVETVAWGLGEESWSVDYKVLWGDPLHGDVWDDLDEYLDQTFLHETGAQFPISAAALDTGGGKGDGGKSYTQTAYDYVKRRKGRRLFAIKGIPGWGRPVVAAPSRKKGRRTRPVDLFPVGVDEVKLIVHRRLALPEPGPGYCHFPDTRDPEYFQQLTAEKLVTRHVKGYPVREWKKSNDARNEAQDCRGYAFAALKIMNPNLARLAKKYGADAPGAGNSDAVAETAVRLHQVLKGQQGKEPPAKPQSITEAALQYVDNANGSAALADFIRDHAPVGMKLWAELKAAGLVEVREGKIHRATPAEDNAPEESKPARRQAGIIERSSSLRKKGTRKRRGKNWVNSW